MLEMLSYVAGNEQTAGLIPPGSTTFHLLLAVHIAAALTCVVTGAAAALSPKRPGRHPRFGTLYYRSLTVVVASAAWLAALRWPQDAYLLVLGTLSFAAAALGRTARRRRWQWQRWRWIGLHLSGMSASYILLLTAFYVDNGKNLPVWKTLPHLAYWLLPSAVGLPLVARALARHRGLAPHPRRPAASPYSLSPWPSAGRSARRLIAASQLRRIAPLAGRISHQ